MFARDLTEIALLRNKIRELRIPCDEIGNRMDISKRKLVLEQFNKGMTSVLLVTSGTEICTKRDIQYLYLNNNSIDTLNTLVHFYYGCHLRKVNFFRIGDVSLFLLLFAAPYENISASGWLFTGQYHRLLNASCVRVVSAASMVSRLYTECIMAFEIELLSRKLCKR